MEDPFVSIAPSSVPGSSTLEDLFSLSDSHPPKPTAATQESYLHRRDSVSSFRDGRAGDTLSHENEKPATDLPPSPPSTTAGEGRLPEMTLSSSPVLYPFSSSPPPALPKKRRLFQTLDFKAAPKKPRIVGGFLEDEDEQGRRDAVKQTCKEDPTEFSEAQAPSKQQAAFPIGEKKVTTTKETQSTSPSLPPVPRLLLRRLPAKSVDAQTSSGQTFKIPVRAKDKARSYEEIVAQRSTVAPGRARRRTMALTYTSSWMMQGFSESSTRLKKSFKSNKLHPNPSSGQCHVHWTQDESTVTSCGQRSTEQKSSQNLWVMRELIDWS